jgi:N-acetylmuramoyl-L-alanine amidase
VVALALAVGSSAAQNGRDAPPDAPTTHSGAVGDAVPVTRVDGEPYLGVNDFARLLDAVKFWRPDVRKLELKTRTHRVVLTVDNPFVVIDRAVVRLPVPVRLLAGEVQVPVALVDSLPRDTTIARLLFGPGTGGVVRVPPGSGALRSPQITRADSGTRFTFPVDRPQEVTVIGRARARFRIRVPGTFVGVLPDSLPAWSLVRGSHAIPSALGSAFEFDVSPLAQGFRIVTDAGGRALALEFLRSGGAGIEEFAPEDTPGPRGLRVIVIDPGHGGADAGVLVNGLAEKDLALTLARLLRIELEHRLPVHVLLTRDDDHNPSAQARAERMNQVKADLVISLHFDGLAGSSRRGATAWCAPARMGMPPPIERRNAPVTMLPWREVSQRHAVRSRALAEAVLGALELHGDGPTRLRERLTYPLLGVDAPALMLDCATLTSAIDRARLTGSGHLRDLAAAVADGIVAYDRKE